MQAGHGCFLLSHGSRARADRLRVHTSLANLTAHAETSLKVVCSLPSVSGSRMSRARAFLEVHTHSKKKEQTNKALTVTTKQPQSHFPTARLFRFTRLNSFGSLFHPLVKGAGQCPTQTISRTGPPTGQTRRTDKSSISLHKPHEHCDDPSALGLPTHPSQSRHTRLHQDTRTFLMQYTIDG